MDKSEDAAGVAMARRLGMRVVIGETHREDILRAACVSTCQALVSVTSSDSVNLETALHARALASDAKLGLPNRSHRRYPQGRSSPVVLQGLM